MPWYVAAPSPRSPHAVPYAPIPNVVAMMATRIRECSLSEYAHHAHVTTGVARRRACLQQQRHQCHAGNDDALQVEIGPHDDSQASFNCKQKSTTLINKRQATRSLVIVSSLNTGRLLLVGGVRHWRNLPSLGLHVNISSRSCETALEKPSRTACPSSCFMKRKHRRIVFDSWNVNSIPFDIRWFHQIKFSPQAWLRYDNVVLKKATSLLEYNIGSVWAQPSYMERKIHNIVEKTNVWSLYTGRSLVTTTVVLRMSKEFSIDETCDAHALTKRFFFAHKLISDNDVWITRRRHLAKTDTGYASVWPNNFSGVV